MLGWVMRKFLLWDHDGVIVDTGKWNFAATNSCLRTLGCELDEATYLDLMARGQGYWDAARQNGISEAAIHSARCKRDALYQDYLTKNEIEIEGVADVLRELFTTHRMAIVTTARRQDFELIHRSRQLRQYFEFVIALEDCSKPKPAPEPYLCALRRFNASPSDALAIEDSSRGLHSALSAGVNCVIVRNAFTDSQDFSGAYSVLSSERELPSFLR